VTTPRAIQPLRLFSIEALRAGWYLAARVLPWMLPYPVLGLAVFFVGTRLGFAHIGAVIACSIFAAAFGVFINRSGRVASRWAESRWGRALPDDDMVWLSILWRAMVALMKTWFVTSPALILIALADNAFLLVVGVVLSATLILAAGGHAMSRVAAARLADREPEPPPSA